jgi:ribokinase
LSGRGRVVVVGSVNVDLTLPVAQLPAPGATVLAGDPRRAGGGKGANVAVAAARAGAGAALVAAVGDDEDGAASLRDLASEGVDTGAVRVLAGRPTGLAVICVDQAGENHIVVAPGANMALAPAHVEAGLARSGAGDVCVLSFEIPPAAIAAAARAAAATGARLVVNPSPVRELPPEVLAARPTVVANAGEVRALTGEVGVRAGARARRSAGAAAVVATLGACGADVTTVDGEQVAVPAVPADVVDTTGAGDSFTGVLAAALAAGAELVTAARRAAEAAARSTESHGARGRAAQ